MQDVTQIELIILGKELEITVLDSADRTVTVEKPVERIVTTHGHHVETMRALKLEMDKIVGVSRWTLTTNVFFPEFGEENNIGGAPYDVEKIMSLQPDVVMIYTTSGTSHSEVDVVSDKLESAGIAVIRIDCYKINNYVDEIRKLGYILDTKDEAEEFIDFYEGQMNTITETVEEIPDADRPKVYFESYKPYRTCGKGGCRCLEIEMAGGDPIFNDNPDVSLYVDPEAVIDRDPEIMIIQQWPLGEYSTTDITELEALRDELINRPELATVTAVKEGNVYVIGSCFMCKPVRFVGLAYMAKWFHPELFKDLDPQAIHQEYLERFHTDLNFDVYEDGVFVYPPVEES
jgi:iron complex transport system substrate-binding protein